jgi:hypothetical protein
MNGKNHFYKSSLKIFSICFLVLVLLVSSQAVYFQAAAQSDAEPEDLAQESGENYTPDLVSSIQRTIRFPANALNYNKASLIMTQDTTGIRWQSNFVNGAFLIVPRPVDWDGVSNVSLDLYFTPVTGASGNVQFFIRPRAFNPGDLFADASSLSGDVVPVSQANQVRKQTITIPAARFDAKELWVITIQRQDSKPADDVYLTP